MDLKHGGALNTRCSEILSFYPAFPAAMRHLATSGHGTSSLQEYLFDKLSAFGYLASWVFGVSDVGQCSALGHRTRG
jgi:hypothetical protein